MRPDLAQLYREQGYAVVEDALTATEVEAILHEAVCLCRGERGVIRGMPQIPAGADDDAVVRQVLCIHQGHRSSPLLRQVMAHPVVVDALTRVIGPDVKCMQSMLFIKAAGKPGQAWHQDEDYIPTRDRSLTGAWIALDDADTENGCLWVIPGSHRSGVLWPQYPQKDERFDCQLESFDFPWTDDDAVPVVVKRGSLVLFNGYTLHRSLPNRSSTRFRRALVNHYSSAQTLLPWFAQEGKSISKMDYRGIVMVAGTDPYAYKGVETGGQAFIRPSGEGGCGDGRMTLEEFKAKGMPAKAAL